MIKFAKICVALCFLILTLFGSGCRGYEDGPVVSMRTVENRIQGAWEATSFSINQIDYLSDLDTLMGASEGSVPFFRFYRRDLSTTESNFSFAGIYGFWRLDEAKAILSIYTWKPNYIPTAKWEIKKLTRKEMHLEGKSDSGEIYQLILSLAYKLKS